MPVPPPVTTEVFLKNLSLSLFLIVSLLEFLAALTLEFRSFGRARAIEAITPVSGPLLSQQCRRYYYNQISHE
jgi:hypothetical protein